MRKLSDSFGKALLIGLLLAGTVFAQEPSNTLEQARKALQTGNYSEARKLFEPFLTNGSALQSEPVLGYFETFLATGEYKDGLDRVESCLKKTPNDPYLLHMKARLLVVTGNYADAEKIFSQVQKLKSDFIRNQLETGDLMIKTGRKTTANRYYSQITAQFEQNDLRTAETIGIAARAYAEEGNFHESNRVFRIAYDLEPQNIRNFIWWGDLFADKYNDADAQRTFEEALAINPHSADLLIGYSRSFDSIAQWEMLANKALVENPNCVDAWNILVGIQILDGNYKQAEQMVNKVLEINPVDETSLANLATVYYLTNQKDKFTQIEQKMVKINIQCGGFYLTLAQNCEYRYLYKDTVTFCQRAILRQPDNMRAYSLGGVNILRSGQVDLARKYLDTAFQNDPFDIQARNTLELIDEYKDFATSESEHFTLIIRNSEKEVLAKPILDLAEECYDSLQIRYKYTPPRKVRLEAYDDHDDFAVRISGLPGVGLLGVTFGDVVAFDTPKAQAGTEYNWCITLWHELAHVMTLGLSDNRVPRWFTEGLSVYEEGRARPEWTRQMDLELFTAMDQNVLLPLRDINKGFTRPEFPEQIMLTYYQSARLVQFMAEHYGFPSILGLLNAFKTENDLDTVFQTVLNKTPEQVEKEFLDSLQPERAKLAPVLAGIPLLYGSQEEEQGFAEKLFKSSDNPFFQDIQDGYELLQNAKYDDAEKKFQQAMDLYPEYTAESNPYTGLAEIYRKRGEEPKLMTILEKYLTITNVGAKEARELAQLYENHGDVKNAEKYYERSIEAEPYDLNAHVSLAELYRKQELYSSEAGERRIIIALNPVDRAEAYYNLGMSLYRNNQVPEAKTEILKSLELAPGYRDAQKLLLLCAGKQ